MPSLGPAGLCLLNCSTCTSGSHSRDRVMVASSCGSDRLLFAGTAGIVVCLSMAASCHLTAWMHHLLSVRYPMPEGQQVEYGVVLGYALHRNGSCTQPLRSRVAVGVQLYKQGAVARLIFSGAHPGSGVRNVSEANAMSAYALSLLEQPPPADRWLLEEQSTSTRTNAVFSLEMIRHHQQQQQEDQEQGQHQRKLQAQVQQQQQQHSTLVLVTNPFHQLRSYYTFKRAAQQAGMNVQVYVAAAPFAGHHGYGHWMLDAAMDQVDFWRELAALAWYGVRGYI